MLKFIYPHEYIHQINFSGLARRYEFWKNLQNLTPSKNISLDGKDYGLFIVRTYALLSICGYLIFTFGIWKWIRELVANADYVYLVPLSLSLFCWAFCVVISYANVFDTFWISRFPGTSILYEELLSSETYLVGTVKKITIHEGFLVIDYEFVNIYNQVANSVYFTKTKTQLKSGDEVIVWYSKRVQVLL